MPQMHVSKTSKVFAQLTLSGMCKLFFLFFTADIQKLHCY